MNIIEKLTKHHQTQPPKLAFGGSEGTAFQTQESYDQIEIGVGLYRDYGPAQKLYFQLGYAPDGNGITYRGQPTIPGQTYTLDDDLILWLVKILPSKEGSA